MKSNNKTNPLTSQHTFFGGDRAKHIPVPQRYTKDQDAWHQFSDTTKKDLLQFFPGADQTNLNVPKVDTLFPRTYKVNDLMNTKVMRAYAYLASKRQEIASQLRQGESGGRTSDYGNFRDENMQSSEVVTKDNNGIWAKQKDSIFENINSLISKAIKKDGEMVSPNIKKDYEITSYEDMGQDGSFTLYQIDFCSPHETPKIDGFPHSTTTLCIMYKDYLDTPQKNQIELYYTPIDKSNMIGDCHLADRYIDECLQAKDDKQFMISAGKLSHLLAQTLWVKLGNAAITEWLVDTLAKWKGIELGPHTFDDKITWDWKALVTPNRDEYAQWFAEKSFAYVKVADAGITEYKEPSEQHISPQHK